ncbi:MAG: inner membrane CreD family protein [Saprospirales bacterium]|nr:inner membrane CreD family protein [Saprospirales bacterium]
MSSSILRKFHIHPLQYFLIGIALIVFFLLLLSLSEQSVSIRPYLIASVATVGLISGYSGFFPEIGPSRPAASHCSGSDLRFYFHRAATGRLRPARQEAPASLQPWPP